MYNILKDEYGFSTRGINSWWGDIVSKTKTAARQGIQAISDFTNPLAGGETGGLGSYVPPTYPNQSGWVTSLQWTPTWR